MKKGLITILMTPYFFLSFFSLLLFRFKLKYGVFPSENPIDPKSIGMTFHIKLVDFLIVCTFLCLPILLYIALSAFRLNNTKMKIVVLVSALGMIVSFYMLKFSNIMEWYFD